MPPLEDLTVCKTLKSKQDGVKESEKCQEFNDVYKCRNIGVWIIIMCISNYHLFVLRLHDG